MSQSLDGTVLRTQPPQQPSVGPTMNASLMGQARTGSAATLARPASGTRLKAPYSTGQPGRHVLYYALVNAARSHLLRRRVSLLKVSSVHLYDYVLCGDFLLLLPPAYDVHRMRGLG